MQLIFLEFSLKLGKADILGTLATIVDERTRIRETNISMLLIAKWLRRDVSRYSRHFWCFVPATLQNAPLFVAFSDNWGNYECIFNPQLTKQNIGISSTLINFIDFFHTEPQ